MNHLALLETITIYIGQFTTAVPIVMGAVAMISGLLKGITGQGATLGEIADMVGNVLGANDAKIKAEIARLKAILGVDGEVPSGDSDL